ERGRVERAFRLRVRDVRALDVAERVHRELDVDVALDAALARRRGILGRVRDLRLERLRVPAIAARARFGGRPRGRGGVQVVHADLAALHDDLRGRGSRQPILAVFAV